jgi:hypothetical protein
MTIELNLLKHGFKHFNIHGTKELYENCDKFYQLKVWSHDCDKKLYFINCHLYDYKDFPQAPDSLKEDLQAMFKVQFSFGENEVFNVDYSTQNVEDALQFFEKMYTSMNCTAYDD